MTRLQWVAVALTIALSGLDGYDVLSVTFAGPAILRSWHLGKAALGLLLASGLAGMALGSLAVGPVADILGRRRAILGCLVTMTVGMALSATAPGLAPLIVWRVLTGAGIGGCVAVITPIAAEFSNARWRPFAISAMAIGYPIGGAAGGLCAAALLQSLGWPAIFALGALLALAMLPVTALALPESLAFLLSSPREDRLDRVNQVLSKLGLEPAERLPPPSKQRRAYGQVFSPAQLPTTLWICSANLLVAASAYFVLSWLPQIVVDRGFSPSSASLAAAVANLSGIVGGLALGAIASRFGPRRPAAICALALGAAIFAFGRIPAVWPATLLCSAACGVFLFASISAIYALLAECFVDAARASGVGFVIGVGRLASAVSPAAAGWLFQAGASPASETSIFAVCALTASLLLLLDPRKSVGGDQNDRDEVGPLAIQQTSLR